MKYRKLILGQVKAVVNELRGMEGVKRLLSGKMVVKETERKFEIWKTIKLGTGLKTADDFRYALRHGRFKTSGGILDLLRNPAFKVADEKTEIDLVKVTVAELGFKKGARLDQLYERARKFGLELCSPEVGPQLRLQYRDQPKGECIFVAMEPIVDSDGRPRVFVLEHRDSGPFSGPYSGLWFVSSWCRPIGFWSPGCPWIFCHLRK